MPLTPPSWEFRAASCASPLPSQPTSYSLSRLRSCISHSILFQYDHSLIDFQNPDQGLVQQRWITPEYPSRSTWVNACSVLAIRISSCDSLRPLTSAHKKVVTAQNHLSALINGRISPRFGSQKLQSSILACPLRSRQAWSMLHPYWWLL